MNGRTSNDALCVIESSFDQSSRLSFLGPVSVRLSTSTNHELRDAGNEWSNGAASAKNERSEDC